MKRYAVLLLAIGLALLLVVFAPVAMASSSQRTAPALKAPAPVPLPAEEEEEDYGPEMSEPIMAEIRLIGARDVLPAITQYVMAEFIWQADPAAACEAATAMVADGARFDASVARLRARVTSEGGSVDALNQRMGATLAISSESGKVRERFCKRAVALDLSPQDRAAFKKGAALLNTVMTELETAVSAKVAGDEARACVSLHVTAATASDFQDFIAAEAKASEVMKVMNQSRVMRRAASIRGFAESLLEECEGK